MKEIHSLTETQDILAKQRGVMLYFYSDRCAPCISLRPKVTELINNKFPEIELVFINSEKYPDIPAHFGVFSNPSIILFIDHREYFRNSKYISEDQLAEQTDRLYKMAFE
ncbi:MAG: thioredoxin family protein [Bacteroidota bacterium]